METRGNTAVIVGAVVGVLLLTVFAYVRALRYGAYTTVNDFLKDYYASIQKDYPKLEENMDAIRSLPLTIGRSHDAGPELETRIRWGADSKDAPAGFKNFGSFLAFTTVAGRLGMSWPAHVNEIALLAPDVSWMSRLKNYDHWALDDSPRVKKIRAESGGPLAGVRQGPVYKDFVTWSLARLVVGMKSGAIDPAISEVGQLAVLLWSTENTGNAEISLLILKYANLAAMNFRVGSTPAPRDPILTDRELEALKTTLEISGDFLNFTTPPAVLKALFEEKGLTPTICITLNSSFPRLISTRALLGARFPEAAAEVNQIVNSAMSKCRLSAFVENWKNTAFIPSYQTRHLRLPDMPDMPTFNTLYDALDPVLASIMGPAKDELPPMLRLFEPLRVAVGTRAIQTGLAAARASAGR